LRLLLADRFCQRERISSGERNVAFEGSVKNAFEMSPLHPLGMPAAAPEVPDIDAGSPCGSAAGRGRVTCGATLATAAAARAPAC
jgi:hypothetical protein